MSLERLNPDTLHPTPGYHHVTVVPHAHATAYLAGQCPLDTAGDLVGEADRLAQVDQVVRNTMVALRAANATPEDVVRTTIYVVADGTTPLGDVWRRFLASELAPAFTSASTLVGVVQLGFPGQLVELDVTAIIRT
jgi:enamine deaminase RidA (YjgF/YER057c/UK114 family)